MGHWEVIDYRLYWFDDHDVCVAVEDMDSVDWWDAFGIEWFKELGGFEG